MDPVYVVAIVALLFAVVEQIDARGRSLLAWSVILLCIYALWGLFF